MLEIVRRKWWAMFLPLFAIVGLMAALIPGNASAALGTGTITGTITTASGTALEGVGVDVENSAGEGVYGEDTDANGAYSIPDVTVGTYYIYIDPSDEANANNVEYAGEWYGATPGASNSQDESSATAVTVTNGGTSTVSDSVTTGAAISGKVTDATTSDPLGDGDVELVDQSGNEYDQQEVNNATGTYSFQGLPSGTYYLELYGDENGAVDGEWYDETTDEDINDASAYFGSTGLLQSYQDGSGFTLTAGSATPTTENVALPTATSVSGTVTTGGNLAGDVYVQLRDAAGNVIQSPESNNYTDGDPSDAGYGTYTVNNLLPGTYTVQFEPGDVEDSESPYANDSGSLAFQFYNNASTLAAATTVAPTAAAPSTGINASLVNGGQITGTVTSAATGKPVDALVELLDANGNVLEEAENNTDGTYALDGIPTGPWYVEFVPVVNENYYAFSSSNAVYQDQYDGDSQTLGSAKSISVTAGSTTSGINATFGSITTPTASTTVTTTTTTTTPVPAAIPTIAGSTPTISGTAKVGDTLKAVTGIWTAGTTFSYQWFAGGKAILGATASTLKLTAADYRKVIALEVTGAQSGYYSTATASATTKAVVAGTLTTKVPTITGTKKVGDRLTAKPGIWTAGTKFTYQWYAGGKAIKGATKSTFRLAAAEESKAITVKVTGKLTGYTTVAKTSKATAKIS